MFNLTHCLLLSWAYWLVWVTLICAYTWLILNFSLIEKVTCSKCKVDSQAGTRTAPDSRLSTRLQAQHTALLLTEPSWKEGDCYELKSYISWKAPGLRTRPGKPTRPFLAFQNHIKEISVQLRGQHQQTKDHSYSRNNFPPIPKFPNLYHPSRVLENNFCRHNITTFSK